MEPDESRIRTDAEQSRVQEQLLLRFNTIAVVCVAALEQLASGVEIDPDEVRGYARELSAVAADARAVASEEAP